MTTISLTEKRLMAKLAEIERRPQPRAVLHFDDRGEPSLYADDGVTVYWVDERVPHDRIFRSRPVPIPVGDAIPFEIVEKSAIRKRRGLFSGLRARARVVQGAAIAGVVTSPPASPAPPPHQPADGQ